MKRYKKFLIQASTPTPSMQQKLPNMESLVCKTAKSQLKNLVQSKDRLTLMFKKPYMTFLGRNWNLWQEFIALHNIASDTKYHKH
jgi:hypothetical protein